MTFALPFALVALPLVIAASIAWQLGARRARARARALTRRRLHSMSPLAFTLLLAAAMAAVVAASAPRWGSRTLELPREGAEVVFILDVSRSMAATDVPPSRIAAARTAIDAAIANVDGDRVGLVIFGGSGYLRFPPTTDLEAAREVVRSVDAGAVFVEPGSSIAVGLAAALELPSPPEEDTGRVFVLVSDGDDIGVDPVRLAALLPGRGIELIVAGVGTAAGGTVPVFDSHNQGTAEKLDADGNPIVSRLDEDLLLRLAREAAGGYLGTDLSLLPGTLAGQLSALRAARFDARETEVPTERFPVFAVAALVLLLLGIAAEKVPAILGRRFGSAVGAMLALAALAAIAVSCGGTAEPTNERGIEAFVAGDYRLAADLFATAADASPRDLQVELNRGLALRAAGDAPAALAAARRVEQSARPELQGAAHALEAHIHFDAGDLPAARDAFARALRADPLPSYRHDYEVVLRLMSSGTAPTPAPGASPTAGAEGSPSPGAQGTPVPGQTPGPPDPSTTPAGTPVPGQPGQVDPRSLAEADDRIARIDREIALLAPGPGESVSREDALHILELLAERARLAAYRESLGGERDPRDY